MTVGPKGVAHLAGLFQDLGDAEVDDLGLLAIFIIFDQKDVLWLERRRRTLRRRARAVSIDTEVVGKRKSVGVSPQQHHTRRHSDGLSQLKERILVRFRKRTAGKEVTAIKKTIDVASAWLVSVAHGEDLAIL